MKLFPPGRGGEARHWHPAPASTVHFDTLPHHSFERVSWMMLQNTGEGVLSK